MIKDLEYVDGGINSLLMMMSVKEDKWRALLDTWGTIIESVIEAMEDEDEDE